MKSTEKWKTAVFAVLLAVTPGCFWFTTKHEGTTLREDLDALEARVQRTEDGLGSKVARLEKVLDEATKLLTRNSADLGAEVEDLARDQAELNGLVQEAKRYVNQIQEELAERNQALEQRIAALEKGGSASTASSPSALYDRAEALLRKRDYQSAISEFQRVFEQFPQSTFADRALFRAGQAAQALKWCTDARAYYSLLGKKYPKSSLVRKARVQNRRLKRLARNKRRCRR